MNKDRKIRLNKFIADSGITSRRNAEELITQARVSVNDKIIIDLSFKVDPEKDSVELDGEKISPQKNVYYLLNKPKGVVTTTADEKNRKTVVDLIKSKESIYPVGRLDYNTTGVLILTNDGDFSYLLTHPKNEIPRVYEVTLDRPLTEEDKEKLLKGIFLEGGRGRFTKVSFPKHKNRKLLEVTGVEGRNHFVKKMFAALSYTVIDLNRKSFAGIKADIRPGEYRKLTTTEIEEIKKAYAG